MTLIVSNKHSHHSANLGSSYASNTFSMIGTIFLWILWPSFNAAIGTQLSQPRAIVNTVLSLCGSGLMATAISKLVRPERKFDMEDFENATLAGGVAIGSFADFRLNLGGALTVGTVAGTLSVLGFRYLGPYLRLKMGLKDTCGIHNLHGIPGLIGGVGSIIAARTASRENYGSEFDTIFPRGEDQWIAQIISLAITLGIAIVGGIIVGYFLKLLYVSPHLVTSDVSLTLHFFFRELHPTRNSSTTRNTSKCSGRKNKSLFYMYHTNKVLRDDFIIFFWFSHLYTICLQFFFFTYIYLQFYVLLSALRLLLWLREDWCELLVLLLVLLLDF